MGSDVLTVYNGDEVDILFGAVILESGRGEDEFCRITKESPNTEDVAGVDGEVAVSRITDGRHTVVVTVLQTAAYNDELSVFSNLAQTSPKMAGAIQPLVIKDKNGRSLYEAANAWISSPPEATFGRVAGMREWTFRCANLIRVDGGNTI